MLVYAGSASVQGYSIGRSRARSAVVKTVAEMPPLIHYQGGLVY